MFYQRTAIYFQVCAIISKPGIIFICGVKLTDAEPYGSLLDTDLFNNCSRSCVSFFFCEG